MPKESIGCQDAWPTCRWFVSEFFWAVDGSSESSIQLQREIERDEAHFEFKPQRDDVFVVGSLLKVCSCLSSVVYITFLQLYLRELPEPLFRFPLQDRTQVS